jgi:hypothetical protein
MFRFSTFILFFILGFSLKAIDFKLGIMAGANSSLNQLHTYRDITKTDPKLGYNANLFARLKFSSYIVQPELGYLMNRVGFSVLENGLTKESNFNLGQMYSSILMGFKFSKIRFSLGPMIIFTANQNFSSITSKETVIQQINDGRANLGAMANIGLDISKHWGIEVKASRTLTESEFNTVIQNNSFNFSGNTGMLSIMLSYSIFNTK